MHNVIHPHPRTNTPPQTTGGPPLATTKCVMATAVATGGAAMGSAVTTDGLPWVVNTGPLLGAVHVDYTIAIHRFTIFTNGHYMAFIQSCFTTTAANVILLKQLFDFYTNQNRAQKSSKQPKLFNAVI